MIVKKILSNSEVCIYFYVDVNKVNDNQSRKQKKKVTAICNDEPSRKHAYMVYTLIFLFLSKHFDIICLQDTHINPKLDSFIKSEWGFEAYFSSYTTNSRGVMVLFNNILGEKRNASSIF